MLFYHDTKEVFICWLSRTNIAGLVSECSPEFTSWPWLCCVVISQKYFNNQLHFASAIFKINQTLLAKE